MKVRTHLQVLLVDNYDSYTGNLLQLIWCETGERPDVVTNDMIDCAGIEGSGYTHIVLGPGPGTPHKPEDVGEIISLIRNTSATVLGVCLGFQAIAVALGGQVVVAPEPAHGVISRIHRSDSLLFEGLPQRIDVVRYHSLCVRTPTPRSLQATAWTDEGILMAAEAPNLGLYGVQFHPESIGTQGGMRLLSNFLKVQPKTRRTFVNLNPATVIENEGALNA